MLKYVPRAQKAYDEAVAYYSRLLLERWLLPPPPPPPSCLQASFLFLIILGRKKCVKGPLKMNHTL